MPVHLLGDDMRAQVTASMLEWGHISHCFSETGILEEVFFYMRPSEHFLKMLIPYWLIHEIMYSFLGGQKQHFFLLFVVFCDQVLISLQVDSQFLERIM